MKATVSILANAALVAVLFSSCGSGETEPASTSEDTTETTVQVTEEDGADIILPSPLQIARIFQRSGLPYQAGLIHSTEEAAKYEGRMKKVLNFGVYSADLAYLALNKQSAEAPGYLKTVRSLGSDIGLSPVFNDERMIKSFENNIGQTDSMVNILVQIQEKMQVAMEDGGQEFLNSIIFAGAWIESMYLGSQLADRLDNEGLGHRIVEQMTILDGLIRSIGRVSSEMPEAAQLATELEKIRGQYKNLASTQALEKGSEDLNQFALTNEERKALANTIAEVRTAITGL